MFSVLLKIITNTKKQQKMAHSKEKNNSTESVSNGDSMAAILDKDCKTTALKLLKELKEDVEKIMKTICEQNGDINR